MKGFVSFSVAAVLSLSATSLAHAEFPTFELNGLPITVHQLSAVDSAQIRESLPTPTTLGSVPASPHQKTVLAPRPRLTEEQITEKLMKAGLTQFRLVIPAEYTVLARRNGSWIKLSVDTRTGAVR